MSAVPSGESGGRVCIADHVNVAYVVRGLVAALRDRGVPVTVVTRPREEPPPDTQVLMTCSAYPCSRERMQALPQLRGVAALASGTDNIDVKAATELGLVVAHSPTPENVTSMAEATVLLILAALYRLDVSCEQFRQGWKPAPHEPVARTLATRTVGLVGFGRIAGAVAHRLANWDVELLASTRRADPPDLPAHVRHVRVEELFARSDVVTLHGRLDATSGKSVDEALLSRMKPGAVLVNTARGGLIDEEALQRGLARGRPSAVALDCYREEPLPMESPLRHLPNAILTPHGVGHTRDVQDSLVRQGLRNALDIASGRVPEFVRNPDVLGAWTERR